MAVIVTDNKSCYSYYKPESRWLRSAFRGIVNFEMIKEHLKNGQKFSEDHEICGALVDIKTFRGSSYKLFEFLEHVAYPKLISRGLNTQASIISDDLLIAHVTEKLMAVFKRLNITAKVFTDIEEGRTWLKEN